MKSYHVAKLYICDITRDQCGDTIMYNERDQPDCENCDIYKNRESYIMCNCGHILDKRYNEMCLRCGKETNEIT